MKPLKPKLLNKSNTRNITYVYEYREKLNLGAGSVVAVELKNDKILVEKPKADLKALFGTWTDLDDKKIREIKKVWSNWNEKNIPGF